MSLRISLGLRWLQLHVFEYIFANAYVYLSITYGNCSNRSLIEIYRRHNGTIIGTFRGKIFYKKKASLK